MTARYNPGHAGRIEDPTRREPPLVTVAAAFFAGCGDGNYQPSTPATATRIIHTANGNVEIPARPERVVCVNNDSICARFGVGFTPIGIPDAPVGLLTPDLILGVHTPETHTVEDAYHANLRAIAPTTLVPLTGTGDWAQVSEQFADAAGRTGELEEVRPRYRDQAAYLRTTDAAVMEEARRAIANEFQGGWVLWYPDSFGGRSWPARVYGSPSRRRAGPATSSGSRMSSSTSSPTPTLSSFGQLARRRSAGVRRRGSIYPPSGCWKPRGITTSIRSLGCSPTATAMPWPCWTR